jgi:hypothetical protein
LQSASNPYQAPLGDSAAKFQQNSSTGLTWLFGGVGILIACAFILSYLMLAEVPCIKQDCFERNIKIPSVISTGECVVIFVCEYWFILSIVTIGPLVVIERYCSVANKRKIRRSLGLIIGIASLLFTLWVAWAALSAMNWGSLYLT